MQSTELLRRRDHLGPACLVGDIVVQIDAADLGGQALSGGIVQVGQHQFRALARQNARAGGTDARCRARDDADPAVELAHRSLLGFAAT